VQRDALRLAMRTATDASRPNLLHEFLERSSVLILTRGRAGILQAVSLAAISTTTV